MVSCICLPQNEGGEGRRGGGEVLYSFSIYVLGDSMVTLLGAYDAFSKKNHSLLLCLSPSWGITGYKQIL